MKIVSKLALVLLSTGYAASAAIGRLSKSKNKALMRKAMPVNRHGQVDKRRLNEELAITIYDSIAFNSCITLTTSLSNNVMNILQESDTLMTYWRSGQIVTTQSYVLFSICQTSECSYQSEDALYMIDLETYMGLAGYRPQKTIDYCEACEKAQDYCLYGQYETDDAGEEQAEDDAAEDGDAAEGGRALAENNKAQQPVNCTTCSSMGCYDASDDANADDGQVNIENVVEWVEATAQCQKTEMQWEDIDTYSQFMCNSDGTGVEIGIFLDDACSVYTSLESYGNLFPDSPYLNFSTSVVTYPFLNDINCTEDIEWVSPDEYDAENAAQGADDAYVGEPNEYCKQLIESDMILPLDNCAEKGEGEDDDSNDDGMFSGYNYDLAQDDIDDAYAVCVVIYNITHGLGLTVKQNVQQQNVFNSSNTLYDYSARNPTKHSNKAGRAVGITFLVLAVLGAIGFVGFKTLNAKKDSKKQPLVDNTGALA